MKSFIIRFILEFREALDRKGTLTREQKLKDNYITVPSECVVRKSEIINEIIYGSRLLKSEMNSYKDKAILAPTNDETFYLNNKILNILEGDSEIYFSGDSINYKRR